MSESSLKGKVARGAVWVLLEQLGSQVVNFGLGIVLARMLPPSAHGTIALVMVFLSVATVVANAGFGQALVQKKDADAIDFNSVFYVGLAVSLALAAALCLFAPVLARFYGIPELTSIVRCLSVNVPLAAVSSVLNAALYRQMRFDVTFRVSLIVSLVSAAVGATLAFCGFGVWALVWSSVCSGLAGVLARLCWVSWRPAAKVSWARLRPLWNYGWKMLVRQLLSSIYGNLYAFLTGRFYSPATLAFVNKGRNLPEMFANTMSSVLLESSFPALAQLQDDLVRLREAVRRLLVVSSVVALPAFALLAAVADRLVLALYGEAWMPCVPYVRLTCLYLSVFPVIGICSMGMLSLGRSDIVLKLDLGNVALALSVMAICLSRGVLIWYAANVGVSVAYVAFVYSAPSRRILGYSARMMLGDLAPPLSLSLIVAGVAWGLGCVWRGAGFLSLAMCLMVQVTMAALTLVAFAWCFRLRAVREILLLVQSRVPRPFAGFDRVVRHFDERKP